MNIFNKIKEVDPDLASKMEAFAEKIQSASNEIVFCKMQSKLSKNIHNSNKWMAKIQIKELELRMYISEIEPLFWESWYSNYDYFMKLEEDNDFRKEVLLKFGIEIGDTSTLLDEYFDKNKWINELFLRRN